MTRIALGFIGAFDAGTYETGARLAEDRGYEAVWLAEDYFLRDAATLGGAVARATDRIDIGLVVNPYTRSPPLTAMTAASLGAMAGGDVRLAMGAGPRTAIGRFTAYDRPLAHVKGATRLVRRLFAESSVTGTVGPYDLEDVRLGSCPYMPYLTPPPNPDTAPPIAIAAMGPQMRELAGAVGDGWLVSFGYTPEMVADQWPAVANGLARRNDAGDGTGSEFDVAAFILAADRVTDRVREFVARTIATHDREDVLASGIDPDAAETVSATVEDEGVTAAAQAVTDAMAATYVLVADGPRSPADRLDQYVAAGVDCPVLIPIHADHVDPVVAMGARWRAGRADSPPGSS